MKLSKIPVEHQIRTPVQLLIEEFGSLRAVARAISRDPAAVCRWQKTGLIPTSAQSQVLETCWNRGIEITAHEIIFGR